MAFHFDRGIKYGFAEPLLAQAVRVAAPLGRGMRPPDWLNFAGGGDFDEMGRANVALLRKVGGLQAASRVLEIGCGIGRNAAPLTEVLTEGAYDGFDVVRTGIYWCRARVAHPRFSFARVDVRNDFYNPFGRTPARDFSFPFQGARYDVVCAFSVFTHMLADETRRYFEESARMLAEGGRLTATFFALDIDASRSIGAGRAAFRFQHQHGGCAVETLRNPCIATAYDRLDLIALAERSGLAVEAFIPGGWRGDGGSSFQDVMVFRRV